MLIKIWDETTAMVKQGQKSGMMPRTYQDYRKMLSENKLDIVLIRLCCYHLQTPAVSY
jgi:hypothetical protein